MKKPRLTISLRFSLIFTAVVVLIIFGIATMNQILLSKVYESEKRRDLTEAYKTINALFSEDSGVDSLELEKIYSTKNITVYLMDEEGNELFSSSANANEIPPEPIWPDPPENRRPEGERRQWDERPLWDEYPSGDDAGRPRDEFRRGQRDFDYRWVAGQIDERLHGEDYVIENINDNRLGSVFIQLTARLRNGNILYMRTPAAAVDDAAATANRLLLFIGLAAVIVSLIIIALVSGAVTKPVRELTDIARDMSELRFSRRYSGRRSDEIGDLGASINTLSGRLEQAITELKASNARLEKDLELKNAVDRARKEFISNASHELKTPLALISGYAEGLRTNIASSAEDRAFYCDVIVDEAGRMDKIIKELLTMNELESTDVCDKRELELSALVRDIVKRAGILAGQKGVEIGLDCPDGITVLGDEQLLGQAITNYITNAVHYVNERKIIKVRLKETEGGARFSVYNSGNSIPEESAGRIWDSFYKIDKARTRAYGGSGLGLSIVKRSIELHGGKCGFINRGDGVEFFFEV
ncbi:MAG: HAMP domain-containing protein [Oscillospiraceae bacterium]|nr:HAMP domain-containing protein [Oscillospiraceae bacterium]